MRLFVSALILVCVAPTAFGQRLRKEDFRSVGFTENPLLKPRSESSQEFPRQDGLQPVLSDPQLLDLVCQLSDADLAIRRAAAEGLGRIGARATAAIPALMEA